MVFRSYFVLTLMLWKISRLSRIIVTKTKSTSRHIFKQILICIEEAFILFIWKIWNFLKIIFKKMCSFSSQLSRSHPCASLDKKRNTFFNNHICILHITFHSLNLCRNRIVWLLHKNNFPHELSNILWTIKQRVQ